MKTATSNSQGNKQEKKPLIVQSDRTLLLDVHAPHAEECANALIPFAELERSPEHLHTYRLTALSLWNASGAGFSPDDAVAILRKYARYNVPQAVEAWIKETAGRFGKLRLVPAPSVEIPESEASAVDEANIPYEHPAVKSDCIIIPFPTQTESDENLQNEDEGKKDVADEESEAENESENANDDETESAETEDEEVDAKKEPLKQEFLYLVTESPSIFRTVAATKAGQKYLSPCKYVEPEDEEADESEIKVTAREKKNCFILSLTDRGTVKQELLKIGWPVKDDVPLSEGEPLEINLKTELEPGRPFELRSYQKAAACALVGNKGAGTGFGTIVLPCGAGKTIVGMLIMSMYKTSTLIITTNISSVHQWIRELTSKTDIQPDQIAEYTGENKTIKPVTIATYQVLTWRPKKNGAYPHFSLFRKRNWGLIIYDEVHMLPAPIFRVAAEIQAIRRVGLTATLVREDGLEGNVFSLVGPKRYDVPWKELEKTGWIAQAECIEIRLNLPEAKELEYATEDSRKKHRIASENPVKIDIVTEIVRLCPDDKILIIGQYLSQLEELSRILEAPIITGKTRNSERDKIYGDFRNGDIRVLVVSKVANFAIDLPDASMAIQISGTFGSRQEEAQRLGRILRPKKRRSRFFTLITRNTVEEDFGANRQKFLAEQGYAYKIFRVTSPSEIESLISDFDPHCSYNSCGQDNKEICND